jgi:hypothetical protein
MNIRGIAVAIALSICASGCEKGEPGAVGRVGEKAMQVRQGRLVLRDLLVRPVLRAPKVLLPPQVLLRTPFELYASTVRPRRAERSATKTRYF